MDKLTLRQQKFIDFYIETGNATKSAVQAGYSKKTADRIGHENLKKLEKYIQEKMQQKADERIATQDEVLRYLTSVMRGEEKDSFGLDASLQDRTKCAELLGKRYGAFIEKKDVNVDTVIKVTLDD